MALWFWVYGFKVQGVGFRAHLPHLLLVLQLVLQFQNLPAGVVGASISISCSVEPFRGLEVRGLGLQRFEFYLEGIWCRAWLHGVGVEHRVPFRGFGFKV